MAKLTVRKGDTVKVLNGKDAGKTGEIIRALPSDGKVVVTKEAAINVSRVQLICPKCGKPTRFGHGGQSAEGNKIRICKKCGAEF